MLQLEYICTDAEIQEAQSLNLRQQLGKGSRLRTYLVLFGMLAFVVVLAYFQMRAEIAPQYRPWFLALIPVVFVFFVLKRKFARQQPKKPIRFELSDREVIIINDGARVSTPWSGFGECVESPNLFLLVNKARSYSLILPKRVFPDESAQNWFRNQANPRSNAAASTADLPAMHSAPAAADGIRLNFQLGFRDYLNRTLISCWTKVILLLVYSFIFGEYFYSLAHPDPSAVNSPAKVTFVFVLPFFTVGMILVMLFVTAHLWFSHRKHLLPRQFVLGAEQIGIADSSGTGFLPWSRFKYWRENRWSFVIWKGQLWDMFPKRAFASPADIERCRTFLQQNLKNSYWFF